MIAVRSYAGPPNSRCSAQLVRRSGATVGFQRFVRIGLGKNRIRRTTKAYKIPSAISPLSLCSGQSTIRVSSVGTTDHRLEQLSLPGPENGGAHQQIVCPNPAEALAVAGLELRPSADEIAVP